MRIGSGLKAHLAEGELPMGSACGRPESSYTAVMDGIIHIAPTRGGPIAVRTGASTARYGRRGAPS